MGGSFTGPDGAVFIGAATAHSSSGPGAAARPSIGPDGAVLIGPDGAVLIGPDGAAFAGGGIGVGSLRIPVTVFGAGVTRATGCVAVRGGGALPGTGNPGSSPSTTSPAGAASASGRSSGSGASASRVGAFAGAPVTAGIPIIVAVDDLALRITRPFDHNSSV